MGMCGAAGVGVGVLLVGVLLSGVVRVHLFECQTRGGFDVVVRVFGSGALFLECQAEEGLGQVLDMTRLESVRSKAAGQVVEVYQQAMLGKVLVIDGTVQVAEHDEANYHEMSAHVPLAYITSKKRTGVEALVVGGGDAGSLLRILEHPEVSRAVLLDIDLDEVHGAARRHFPALAKALDDPRAEAVGGVSAEVWIEQQQGAGTLDLVVVDVTDCKGSMEQPTGSVSPETFKSCGGSSGPIFQNEFYAAVKKTMTQDGVLIRNLDSPSWDPDTIAATVSQLREQWKHVHVFHLHVPSFLSGHYAFAFASDTINPLDLTAVNWDIWRSKAIPTRYYNKATHIASFVLPEFLRPFLGPGLEL